MSNISPITELISSIFFIFGLSLSLMDRLEVCRRIGLMCFDFCRAFEYYDQLSFSQLRSFRCRPLSSRWLNVLLASSLLLVPTHRPSHFHFGTVPSSASRIPSGEAGALFGAPLTRHNIAIVPRRVAGAARPAGGAAARAPPASHSLPPSLTMVLL